MNIEQHEHSFDRRDTNHSRCLECKKVINDPGKLPKLPIRNTKQDLVNFLNTLAHEIGIWNDDHKKGRIYNCTLTNLG